MAELPPRRARSSALRRLWNDGSDTSSESDSSDGDIDNENDESENEDELNDIQDVHAAGDDVQIDDSSDSEEDNNEFLDKNGGRWNLLQKNTDSRGRRTQANVIRQNAGPTREAHRASIGDTWRLFFTVELEEKIVEYTRLKAQSLGVDFQFDIVGLEAYIAICYFRGVSGDQKIPVDVLWSEDASPFYNATMSKISFKIWTRFLRFDDFETREERKRLDTFAPFRDFWNYWNNRLRMFFIPGPTLTVDEQLVASRTRSPHRIYNPMKPGKYGELIRWICDAEHRYVLNGIPWTKRPADPTAAELYKQGNTAKNLVLELTSPFHGTGRNITGDRFFSGVPLCEELLFRHRLTYLGTLMSNKREIPPILHRNLEEKDSVFVKGGKNDSVVLCLYQAKSKKKVLLISTMHSRAIVEPNFPKKTEMQLHYNASKCGVDVCDQMAKMYTVRTRVNRYPMVHFQNVLDITRINTFTIFNATNPTWSTATEKYRRREFLQRLSKELARRMMERRRQIPNLSLLHKMYLKQYVGGEEEPRGAADIPNTDNLTDGRAWRCFKCIEGGRPSSRANKTSSKCHRCQKPCCKKHTAAYICNNCV